MREARELYVFRTISHGAVRTVPGFPRIVVIAPSFCCNRIQPLWTEAHTPMNVCLAQTYSSFSSIVAWAYHPPFLRPILWSISNGPCAARTTDFLNFTDLLDARSYWRLNQCLFLSKKAKKKLYYYVDGLHQGNQRAVCWTVYLSYWLVWQVNLLNQHLSTTTVWGIISRVHMFIPIFQIISGWKNKINCKTTQWFDVREPESDAN